MKRKSKAPTPSEPPQKKSEQPQPPPGFVGRPLDGSQFRDVIEEQRYSEQRPTPEGR